MILRGVGGGHGGGGSWSIPFLSFNFHTRFTKLQFDVVTFSFSSTFMFIETFIPCSRAVYLCAPWWHALLFLWNYSFVWTYQYISSGICPYIWKIPNVTPIHKNVDKNLVKNYRPISLLPICSKISEKIERGSGGEGKRPIYQIYIQITSKQQYWYMNTNMCTSIWSKLCQFTYIDRRQWKELIKNLKRNNYLFRKKQLELE